MATNGFPQTFLNVVTSNWSTKWHHWGCTWHGCCVNDIKYNFCERDEF